MVCNVMGLSKAPEIGEGNNVRSGMKMGIVVS